MHELDRTTLESSELFEYGAPLASEQYEYMGEYAGELGSILGGIFGEAQGSFESSYEGGYQELPLPEFMEDELAAELLGVGSDRELDHFLGGLFNKVAGTIGKVIKSPVGQALGGVLKQVAKKALPIAGGALGTFVGGPVGGMVGSKLASLAGNAFGLEIEGLSAEDRDFELARRYVRFAGAAAKKAAAARPQADPVAVAKAAVVDAAKKFAPGLLAPIAGAAAPAARVPSAPPAAPRAYQAAYPAAAVVPPAVPSVYPPDYGPIRAEPTCPSCGATPMLHRRQGKWIRKGRHIVVLGV